MPGQDTTHTHTHICIDAAKVEPERSEKFRNQKSNIYLDFAKRKLQTQKHQAASVFPSPIPVTHGRNRCYIHIYSKVWPFQQRTFAARQEARKGENKKQKQKGTVSESITLINWTDCRLTAQNYANSTENKIKFLTYGKLESGEWSVEWSGVLLV